MFFVLEVIEAKLGLSVFFKVKNLLNDARRYL